MIRSPRNGTQMAVALLKPLLRSFQIMLTDSEQTSDCHDLQWFALRVRTGAEKVVSTCVQSKGFEQFLPVYRCRRRWSDRVKSLELPLFPGYLFCRLDPRHRLPLLTIPGVMQFVGIGKTPASIDQTEISAIQAAVRAGLSVEPHPFLEIGRRVRIEQGPLPGVEGVLVKIRGQHRIVVSVTLLKRSVSVEVDRYWVEPVDAVRTVVPPAEGAILARSQA